MIILARVVINIPSCLNFMVLILSKIIQYCQEFVYVPEPDEINNLVVDGANLTSQINLEVDIDDVQELLSFRNQELKIDELIEIPEQEQDM
ncbi:hypothetical protein TNCV_4843301 [Trichonephila clavipes]|uniref:Uncharacterized protein n=1 Tax=Trichonephila clavipes TaxID=2585209 RepID=A0A8X7BLX2_TRICX|nr:hypothetical protein TNCV_4843301 [Trichonephila clavipes]